MRISSILFSLVLFSSAANAKLIYTFDFEKGDISEWGAGPNNIYTDHAVKIVNDPVRTGKFAAKFDLKKADKPPEGRKR